MSRAYQDHFAPAREQSPLSPGSVSSATNFRANVNRQKSKKWVEAKKVDYGGDDWGDEYDDDPYENPYDAPSSTAKPTGFRQPGQGMQSPSAPSDIHRKPYGELSSLLGASGSRSVTGPAHYRANSFDKDDERRAFSSGSPANQQSPVQRAQTTSPQNGPATRFSQMGMPGALPSRGIPNLQLSTAQDPVTTGIHKSDLPPLPAEAVLARQNSDLAPPTATTISSNYSDDFANRTDYSPSAAPPPLPTDYSPVHLDSPDSAATAKFPPRKSSLDQMRGRESPQEPQSAVESASKPWLESHIESPGSTGRARSGSTPVKALPFIRPADIYRRMEEEREKKRRSSESGRPSMDFLLGTRPLDRSTSPANRLRERSSSETSSTGLRPQRSAENFSDPNRRLMPLAPVQERKSEYGFDGFNVNDGEPPASMTHQGEDLAGSTAPQIFTTNEHAAHSQTSPKLPDVDRLSGFGSDFFAQTRPHDSGQDYDAEADSNSSVSDTLKSQPSLGFRSAVNEAFDRGEPMTPMSASESGVRRSDSESTGTTGISPIMSRVPSAATARNYIEETKAREGSTPAIPEEQEPSSQRTSLISPPLVNNSANFAAATFSPAHRRDVRTPSPNNSPARTPDIGMVRHTPSTEVHISESSEHSSSTSDTSDLFPARPAVGRDPSFRPNLPGGWVSYAGSDATDQQDENQAAKAPSRLLDASVNEPAEDEEQTPTTNGRGFPRSVSASPMHDDDTTKEAIVHRDEMPTPDPTMAPSGNPYSSTLDSRLFSGNPPVELPAEPVAENSNELRPPVGDRNPSTASSVGPTPPPKDTPAINIKDADDGYFAPPVPLKQRTLDEIAAQEGLEPPQRPQMIPTLSTDTGPHDDENDKLRKEIVRSLSPRSSTAHEHAYGGGDLSRHSTASSTGGEERNSAYLPSEYDNYWASTADNEPSKQPHLQGEPNRSVPIVLQEEPSDGETPPIPPLSTRRISKQIEPLQEPQPGQLQSQFSWDADREIAPELNKPPTPEGVPDLHPEPLRTPEKRVSFAATPDTQIMDLEQTREAYFENALAASSMPGPNQSESRHPQSELADSDKEVASFDQEPKTLSSESPITNDSGAPQRRSSAEIGHSPALVPSDPLSHALSDSEHSAHLQEMISPTDNDELPSLDPVSTNASIQNSQRFSHGKIPAFKDILAMRDYNQRIRTYDDTREQFASMNTGLNDWLAYLKAQHSEHSDNNGVYGGGINYTHAPSSARSKLSAKIGISHQGSQQPYYQQYLNPSPTSPNPPGHTKIGSGPSGSQQNHAAAKISSQQVQAKSKELLHTAGVFGGKASNIGKGLFAKGKSRFRSGGGDKTSQPQPKQIPPEEPKSPRRMESRSSWTLPLAFSRSPARPVNAPQSTEATTPMQRPRRLSEGPPKLDEAVLGISSTKSRPTSNESVNRLGSKSVDYLREASQENLTQERGDLAGPVPISKQQPSWDPFNATPIAEEEGYFDSHLRDPGHFNNYDTKKRKSTIPEEREDDEEQQVPEVPEMIQDHWSDHSNHDQVEIFGVSQDSKEMEEHEGVEQVEETHPDADFYENTVAPVVAYEHIIAYGAAGQHHPEEFQGVENARGAVPFVSYPEFHGGMPASAASTSQPYSQSVEAQQLPEPNMRQGPSPLDPTQHVRTVSDPPMMYSDALRPSAEYVRDDNILGLKREEPMEHVHHPASFGLPPVRRSSTFGFAFRSRSKKRFPIDDESSDEGVENNGPVKASTFPLSAGRSQNPTPDMMASAITDVQISSTATRQVSPAELAASPSQNIDPFAQQRVTNNTVTARASFEDRNRRGHSSTPLQFDRGLFGKAASKPAPVQQLAPFIEPPSSAQRFPGLFRSQAGSGDVNVEREVLDHYQTPFTREEAMIPRLNQGTEYMVPGIGPPEDLNKPTARSRRSSFVKDLGGRISRTASRDPGSRANSRDGLAAADNVNFMQMTAPAVQAPQGTQNPMDSRPTTPADGKKRGRRGSLLPTLSRSSTADLGTNRDSTSRPVSRDMLNHEPKPTIATQDGRQKLRKGSGQSIPATASPVETPTEIKKKRFSGLTSFLSRRGSAHRPTVRSTASSIQDGTISELGSLGTPPVQNSKQDKKKEKKDKQEEVRRRRTLTKPPPMGETRSRRNSASRVLQTIDSGGHNQQLVQPTESFRHGSISDRGAQIQIKEEPRYITPPIPQAYDLVHGEGNIALPTQYDPRGVNRQPRQWPQQQQNGIGCVYPPARPRAQYFDPQQYHDPLSIAHGSPQHSYNSQEGIYGDNSNSPPRRQNSYRIPMFGEQDSSMSGAQDNYEFEQQNQRSLSRSSGRNLPGRTDRSYYGRQDSYDVPFETQNRNNGSPARQEGYQIPYGIDNGSPARRDVYNPTSNNRENTMQRSPPRMQMPHQQQQGYERWDRPMPMERDLASGERAYVDKALPMDRGMPFRRESWRGGYAVAGPAVPKKDV